MSKKTSHKGGRSTAKSRAGEGGTKSGTTSSRDGVRSRAANRRARNRALATRGETRALTAGTARTVDVINPDLEQIHATLIDLVATISNQIADEDDLDKIRAMVREVEEINHRVNVVGGLLFAAQTQDISGKMGSISQADRDLRRAIAKVGAVTDFVNTATAFLAVVDQVVDLAKVVL